MKRTTALLAAGMIALSPFASRAAYLTLKCDTQSPGNPVVLDRVFTGNTPLLRAEIYERGAALSMTNWTVRFMYGYDRYSTNGLITISGSNVANTVIVGETTNTYWNAVQFVGSTTNLFESGEYYFSIIGTNANGWVKTFATGKMIQDYDPAADTSTVTLYRSPINWDNVTSVGTLSGITISNATIYGYTTTNSLALVLSTQAVIRADVATVSNLANAALTRADAANVTGGIAVGFASAASNLAVLVQGTQVTVQGWAVAASNLAVALQGSQAVIRADVATVSNLANAAQTAGEVAASILNATNAAGGIYTAYTPTSRWVAATGGVARGLLLFDDPGFRWSGTNGYAFVGTNTASDGYAFAALQNNSEDVLQFGVRGTEAAGTLFGVTNAGSAQVYSYAAPLLLGSYGADPVIFGVNNAERFRMTTAGNTNVADLVVTGALAVGGAATVTGPTTNTGGAFYPGTTFEDDQLATAGWVRDLLSIGEPVYMASNTEAVGYYPGTASKGINEASAGNYVSPSVTITGSPQYVHSMIGTQVLSGTLLGPASVDVYVWRKGTGPVGNQSASLAAELYYTMDKTNLFGYWSAPAQTIPSGTNKLSYVISFPNTDVTNAYLVYRLKITAAANTTNINVLGGETYGSYALLRIPNTDSLGVRGATNLTDVGLVYTSRYDLATRTLVVGPTQTMAAVNGWTNGAAWVSKTDGGTQYVGLVWSATNYWWRVYP